MGASTVKIASVGPTAKSDAEALVSELIENVRPVELAIQDEMISQNKVVAQTGAGMVLSEHLRELRAQADRELEELRMIMRKEMEDNAAKMQETIRAQELAIKQWEKKAEEQALAQNGQAEEFPLEREREEREQAACEMEKLRQEMQDKTEAEKVNALKVIGARECEVEELTRQSEKLVARVPWFPWFITEIERALYRIHRGLTHRG